MKPTFVGFAIIAAIILPLPTCRANFCGADWCGLSNVIGSILSTLPNSIQILQGSGDQYVKNEITVILQSGAVEEIGKSLATKSTILLQGMAVFGYAAYKTQQIYTLSEKKDEVLHKFQKAQFYKESLNITIRIINKDLINLDRIFQRLSPSKMSAEEITIVTDEIERITKKILKAMGKFEGFLETILEQIDSANEIKDDYRSNAMWSGITAIGSFAGYGVGVMPIVTIPVGVIATASAVYSKFSEREITKHIRELHNFHQEVMTIQNTVIEMEGEVESLKFELKTLAAENRKLDLVVFITVCSMLLTGYLLRREPENLNNILTPIAMRMITNLTQKMVQMYQSYFAIPQGQRGIE